MCFSQRVRRLAQVFALDGEGGSAIGLCSDALSEGMNLQGASAIVHLDLPTVIRILEQRIGRIDRMDSPHESIQVVWPDYSDEFSLQSDQRLVRLHQEVSALLGSNYSIPDDLSMGPTRALDLQEVIERVEETQDDRWGDLGDVFTPIRDLVWGEASLVPPQTYEAVRESTVRVLSAVGVVESETEWAFMAVAGGDWQVSRWIAFDPLDADPITDLAGVTEILRSRLDNVSQSVNFGEPASALLTRALSRLKECEESLLPRRKARALVEMKYMLQKYLKLALDARDGIRRDVITQLLEMLPPSKGAVGVENERLADWWLDLIKPVWHEYLTQHRRGIARITKLRRRLLAEPIATDLLRTAFDSIRLQHPIDRRVVVAILGLPSASLPKSATS
jgi:Helicase conserved C-terminal domain